MKERQRKRAEMEARGEYESDDDNSSASFHNPDDENEPDEDDGQYDSQPNLENIVKNRYKQKPFWTQFRYTWSHLINLLGNFPLYRNFFLGSVFVFVAILLLNIVPLQKIFGSNTPDDFMALQVWWFIVHFLCSNSVRSQAKVWGYRIWCWDRSFCYWQSAVTEFPV